MQRSASLPKAVVRVPAAIMPRPNGATEAQRHQLGHHRLLRNPDRLGEGDPRRVRQGGRPRRVHASTTSSSSTASSRSRPRSWAAPTSSTPRSCAAPRSRSPARSAGSSSPRERSSCPTASPAGCPFARPTRRWTGSAKRYQLGIISNIDDKLLGVSRRHLRTDLDLVVTAQQVRSYKPDPAHFKEAARRIGGKKGWVHIGSRLRRRRRPAAEDERAGDLGQPPRREARRAKEADRGGRKTFRDAAKKLGAGG